MSFQSALSGLNASSKNLEVIGHNIANSATYGAKSARAEFADMYAVALSGGGGAGNIGIGVQLGAVAQQFTQGNITTTNNPMDIALNGNGFFQVASPSGSVNYTRNGQFKLDKDGFIVNNDNMKLMGFGADNQGNILAGSAAAVQLPTAGIAPNPSSRVDLEMNLDARWTATDPGSTVVPRIDFADRLTYNQATSITTYDAQGKPVAVNYYFQQGANPGEVNVYATANGTTVGGTAANPQPVSTLTFNPDGTLQSASNTTLNLAAVVPNMNNLTMNFGQTTQFGAVFAVTKLSQDGYTAGNMTGVVIEKDGTITGRYSNGQTKTAGQVQIANFRNPQGLQPLGGNLWGATFAAGTPVPGVPGSGNLGSLQSGALEESNVDLTGQLVEMITAQRNYQANAQTIKTQDQVMQTLVNLR